MNVIICPVRAGLEMTREAIDSFYAQDVPVCVFVVDNSDSDEFIKPFVTRDGKYPKDYKYHPITGDDLESQYYGLWDYYKETKNFIDGRSVQFLEVKSDRSLGVAESWNRAIEFVFTPLKHSHVLVCNNDIILRPDAYRLLLEDGGGFVTCVGDANRDAIWGEPRPLDKRPHPDFSCFLIRKWVWDKVGKFDEGFKGAYCEDNDYHLRMNEAGIDAHCIGVPFYHRVSGTMKHLPPDEQQAIHDQAHRNRERFKEKWGCLPGDAKYYEYFKKEAACTR